MSRFLITALAEGFTGAIGALRFIDGQTEADDATHAAEIAYCRSVGHSVEPIDDSAPFDPAQHPVPAVVAYLGQADPDEHARVLAAEADGKARSTILALTQPEAPAGPVQDPTQQGADQ